MSSELREQLRAVSSDATKYFSEAEKTINEYSSFFPEPSYYWNQLPEELQHRSLMLVSRILPLCAQVAELAKMSPLTGAEDIQDVKLAAKTIRAALQLRVFNYSRAQVIHDEGSFRGVQPAEQSENRGQSPNQAQIEFDEQLSTIGAVLKLVEASPVLNASETNIVHQEGSKYVAGTAFIMMWMDPKYPELTDVLDAVKSVFKSFSIRATRADDIEHEGQITERILHEIRASEFLFADLTGMRPNVYYETGYAHALGKRVILFRKSGTNIHFDLAGYNCPEYENLRDLKEKLTRRLVNITNKEPRAEEKI